MKKVAIIGSHGLYANYGGWDQLVINLAEKNEGEIEYLIFNSRDSNKDFKIPSNSQVVFLPLKASGMEGLFYDFISIIIAYIKGCETLLLLGNQGILIIPFLLPFSKKKIITNIGGIEWEREKFNKLQKIYLKLAFHLSNSYSDKVIFDNQHFINLLPKKVLNKYRYKYRVIPYGGDLAPERKNLDALFKKYTFLDKKYFLSVSRAIPDNQIVELIETFKTENKLLVIISNLSTSKYGKEILKKYSDLQNIILINGLYNKQELDTIRRNTYCYIHTHKTCGSAPSLIEMIHAKTPIISFDVPQNRYTLDNSCLYFTDFTNLKYKINENLLLSTPPDELKMKYEWSNIIERYKELF